MVRGWRSIADVPGERLARAAVPLLIIRVVEGLAAWVFFNEFFFFAVPAPWTAQGVFVTYLLLNLLVALRYHRGRVSRSLVGFDLASNLLPLALPIARAGGLASPLVLLFPFKTVQYAIVFNVSVAVVFLLGAAAMLVGITAAHQSGLLSAVPFHSLGPQTAESMVSVSMLAFLIGAPLAIVWLYRVVDADRWVPETRRPNRADRDGTPAAVANALLTVSEAVSRLTCLDEILEKVVEIAPQSLEVDYCGIALWAEDNGTYTGVVAAGAGPTIDRRFAGLQLTPEEVPDFEWARRLGHCAVVPASESLHVAALDMPAVLIAPLVSGERFYGVMEFARRSPHRAFTQRDLAIADGIARQTAVALERARLVEDSRRLVLAVESSEEAVLITDARRRVTFANPAFLRTFGYRGEEVLGRDALEIAGGEKEQIAELTEALQRRGWRGETVVHRKDGTVIPIMLNASLIRDDDGRVQGAVAILEDVSAQKTFQAQMQRADRLAAVGEIAAGIAHEINNALAVIFGQTADGSQRDAEQLRAALLQVDGQARRIANIVQGVLGFARPRPPHMEPVDLATVTSRTLDLVRHDVVRQGVRLETSFDPGLPLAQADPEQLQQVLLNLFSNALQAMVDGAQGWLRVEVLDVEDRLAVRVSDRGPGIPADVLPRIFDPFFSTKAEGSGLGLSVSYAIARAHGGDLQVSSEEGRGTTFTLLLPIAERRTQAVLERVLLVDDDPDVAEALTAMLRKEGLQTSRAATGAEALAMVASDSWDAILLDVRLPDLAGPDVYNELRLKQPELAERVVFVTGGLWRSESRLREELPPQPILAKPCTQDQLRDVLRRLRNQKRKAA